MAQDIRELLKQDQDTLAMEKLPAGHQKRFEARLEQALPQQKKSSRYLWLQIAAVLIVALTAGFFFLYQAPVADTNPIVDTPSEEESKEPSEITTQEEQVTLADISPEFKKVENYYMANLNMGLAKLEITEENKALVDAFMAQLAELDKEYGRLNEFRQVIVFWLRFLALRSGPDNRVTICRQSINHIQFSLANRVVR